MSPDGRPVLPPRSKAADTTLTKALARAGRWQKLLENGVCGSLAEIADKERINRSYLSRTIRLSLLAPDCGGHSGWQAAGRFAPRRPRGAFLPGLATATRGIWLRHQGPFKRGLTRISEVCLLGQTGHHVLSLSLTGFDTQTRPGIPWHSVLSRHSQAAPTETGCLSSKSRSDYFRKSLQLGLRHVVAAGEVMSREQEHMLDACFLPRL